jgi:hypothetical protein
VLPWGLGFRVEGLGLRVQGSGFRIYGFPGVVNPLDGVARNVEVEVGTCCLGVWG